MALDLLLGAPAVPLDEAGRYVAAAYIVFVVLLIVYVGIMAGKLGRISREIESLADAAEGKAAVGARPITELEAEAETSASGGPGSET